MSDSVRPHRQQPTRLPRPRDSPGKNTGVGRHFLLQCMKVKSEREVSQSCPTLSDPMDCSLPGSSTHGIFQARVLELGASAFSKGKSGMHQKMGTYQPKHVIKSHPSRMRARVWRARAFQDWGQGTLSFLVLTPQILLLSCLDLMSNSAY